ncbi:hypothetical protein OIU83_03730 [Flavobacterium sp. LS1R49]|uniref:Uncharacterized protein n=1 Tax=Flavobacterium shii TaxID=2987687 RepID=A0A9X3BXM9_9FLAO|nr:hypothetical protein [Flavobacterium shii]MCV9926741.1 hypothetical protein [Flavobacterium shii]
MAINKTAKNLTIEIKNKYTCIAKTIYETTGKVEIVATKDNLTLVSNKKVIIRGNKS